MINSESVTVCFPEGKKCIDSHGDGAGNPREYDCWDGGRRACFIGYKDWPACDEGYIKQ
jgi:hypothetical protein